ncbi:MAG: hypothetical protein ABH886_04690 [Candidatus Desantisbacteria bacterium]
MIQNTNTTIICPCNDGEASLLIDIAKKLFFDVRISRQGWGAVLSKEPPETFLGLRKNVIVVEMPDVKKEEELGKSHNLFIIDHHKYSDMNRYKPISSLEQFTCLISYHLDRWEMGVVLNDRGYIYALIENGYSDEEIRKIRQFDLSAQGYKPEDFDSLAKDYFKGYIYNDRFFIIETMHNKTSYLADLHFLENEKRKVHLDLVVFVMEQERIKEINFYGTPAMTLMLYNHFGGYCGGDENVSMFWGKETPDISKKDFLNFINNV